MLLLLALALAGDCPSTDLREGELLTPEQVAGLESLVQRTPAPVAACSGNLYGLEDTRRVTLALVDANAELEALDAELLTRESENKALRRLAKSRLWRGRAEGAAAGASGALVVVLVLLLL